MGQNRINLIDKIFELNKKIYKNDDNPSELKVHKALYFIYGWFWNEYKEQLFENANFEAWDYGPVECDYRKSQFVDQSLNSKNKFIINVSKEKEEFLNFNLEWLLKKTAFFLTSYSHLTKPWIENSVPVKEHGKNQINIDEILNFFG